MTQHSPVWSLHATDVYDVYKALGTSEQGLAGAEILKRQQHYGFNELPEQPGRSLWLC
jgi:Cation transporter/ATPase, N-terminus